jgi:hypothetical protein
MTTRAQPDPAEPPSLMERFFAKLRELFSTRPDPTPIEPQVPSQPPE